MPLLILFVAVPILEIALFLQVGAAIGTWETVGIVILTAVLGTFLLRRQGLQALHTAQQRLAAGEAPGSMLADGAMILAAGFLLLTPGFFTDAVGFALLLPPVRRWIWSKISHRIQTVGMQAMAAGGARRGAASSDGHGPFPRGDQTVDGSFTEAREPDDANGSGPRPQGRPTPRGDGMPPRTDGPWQR